MFYIKRGGTINDVTVNNTTVRDSGTTPVDVHGLDAANGVHRVHFENVRMPGSPGPARTAEELRVDATFADGITVTP